MITYNNVCVSDSYRAFMYAVVINSHANTANCQLMFYYYGYKCSLMYV